VSTLGQPSQIERLPSGHSDIIHGQGRAACFGFGGRCCVGESATRCSIVEFSCRSRDSRHACNASADEEKQCGAEEMHGEKDSSDDVGKSRMDGGNYLQKNGIYTTNERSGGINQQRRTIIERK